MIPPVKRARAIVAHTLMVDPSTPANDIVTELWDRFGDQIGLIALEADLDTRVDACIRIAAKRRLRRNLSQ